MVYLPILEIGGAEVFIDMTVIVAYLLKPLDTILHVQFQVRGDNKESVHFSNPPHLG